MIRAHWFFQVMQVTTCVLSLPWWENNLGTSISSLEKNRCLVECFPVVIIYWSRCVGEASLFILCCFCSKLINSRVDSSIEQVLFMRRVSSGISRGVSRLQSLKSRIVSRSLSKWYVLRQLQLHMEKDDQI